MKRDCFHCVSACIRVGSGFVLWINGVILQLKQFERIVNKYPFSYFVFSESVWALLLVPRHKCMREVGHWCVITMLYHTVIILYYSLLPILSTEVFKAHTFMHVFVVCVRDKVWDHSDQHLFTNHIRMSLMWLYPYFRPSVWTGLWIQDHLSLFCLFIKLKQKHCANQQWNYKWFAHTHTHTQTDFLQIQAVVW